MKKTIQVTEVSKRVVEVEIEFPFYRKHDIHIDSTDSVIYSRVEHDGTVLSIQLSGFEWGHPQIVELEIGRWSPNPNDSTDYALGRCEYALTAEEFVEALAKAREFLSRFG